MFFRWLKCKFGSNEERSDQTPLLKGEPEERQARNLLSAAQSALENAYSSHARYTCTRWLNYRIAAFLYRRAGNAFNKAKNGEFYTRAIVAILEVTFNFPDLQAACAFRLAASIQELHHKDFAAAAISYLVASSAYRRQKQFVAAASCIEHAARLSAINGQLELASGGMMNLGQLYYSHLLDYTNADRAWHNAVKWAAAVTDYYSMGKLWRAIGALHACHFGNFDYASACFVQSARSLFKAQGNCNEVTIRLFEAGLCTLIPGNYAALEYFIENDIHRIDPEFSGRAECNVLVESRSALRSRCWPLAYQVLADYCREIDLDEITQDLIYRLMLGVDDGTATVH